jgi:glycerol-3-phosphate dehydrogenase (NAD(P)+)
MPEERIASLRRVSFCAGLPDAAVACCLVPNNRHVMLSGPSIANEFARGLPTVVMLAGRGITDLLFVARLLDNEHFRVRFSDDAIGVELGGILKNAYVIGLGLFDGKQIESVNFRSVYLTLALEEMTRIGVSLGAQKCHQRAVECRALYLRLY